jgi:hypothetical protein
MMKNSLLAIVLVGLVTGLAFAQAPAPAQAPDCAALIKQVRDQVGNRFDGGRHSAVALTAEAEKLHNDKKPADCAAKVQEAAKAAGIAMK